jgi:hypothetical protein
MISFGCFLMTSMMGVFSIFFVFNSCFDRGSRRVLRLVRYHPAVGPHLRPHRAQKNVSDRRGDSASYISAMIDTAIPSAVFIAIVLSLIPHDMQYGPQAALIDEAFTPRLRHSGASLGYQLASVIAGGPAPLIATALFATYHSGYAISIYIAACAAVSLASAAFMPDYTGKDISECRRSGSPANRDRKDRMPSTPSCTPPIALRTGGRQPIPSAQRPKAPERLPRAAEPITLPSPRVKFL